MIALIALLVATAEGACTAAVGGTLHLPDGTAVAGDLVWDQGRIVGVGPKIAGLVVTGPAATWKGGPCALWDAKGQELTAGLVDVADQLGLAEVGAEEATKDADGGGDSVRASLKVVGAYNPWSTLLAVARRGGITDAVVWPEGGQISGQAGWVVTSGESQTEAIVSDSVAVVAHLGPSPSKAFALDSLSELLAEARDYRKNREGWLRNQRRPAREEASFRDLEALGRVTAGEVPLVVWADRAADLEALTRFSKTEGVRVVVAGAAEGWLVAEALAEARIGVIVDPLVYGPGSFDQLHGRPENPAMLAAAGVDLALASFDEHKARTLRVLAGNAVRGGMDHEAALASVTRIPASLFGSVDRGRLAVGSVANVAVWTGDPLEISTNLAGLWVGGDRVGLESRQEALLERYRTLPGSPGAPLGPPLVP